MKILLATIPDGPLSGTIEPNLKEDNSANYVFAPLGILRVAAYIEKNNFETEIYDINSTRGTDEDLIKNFKRIKPDVIGLSGPLTHCYPNLKRITKILRKLFPDSWLITGGAITASANVILEKSHTDICVVGDGEIAFLKLLQYLKENPSREKIDYSKLDQIKGLAYIDERNKLKVNGNAEALTAAEASLIHYPNYDVLKDSLEKNAGAGQLIERFFSEINDLEALTETFFEGQLYPDGLEFFNKNNGKKIGEIMSAQGCVARCTFCQRYIKGYRAYDPKDFETHVIELKEKFNVGGLILNDENSLSNKKQSMEMARIFKKHDIKWTAGGVRANTCSKEDLKFYKDHGLLAIRFGIESGSEKILGIMEKKITTNDALKALTYCRELEIGVATDMFLIGMPGETTETILETSAFSGKLRYLVGKDWNIKNTTLAMAIPGTPLYEYSQQIGVIGRSLDDEEDYLLRISELSNKDILNYVNKTDSNMEEIHFWTFLYRYASRREFVNQIFKSKQPFYNKIKELNEKCIKASLVKLAVYYKKSEKLYNFKHIIQIFFHSILSLTLMFVPKIILFFALRLHADKKFRSLKKIHKKNSGKQKHNAFVKQTNDKNIYQKFRVNENTILKSKKPIDISLRKIVSENRNQLSPVITEEQKGLQVLAEGQ